MYLKKIVPSIQTLLTIALKISQEHLHVINDLLINIHSSLDFNSNQSWNHLMKIRCWTLELFLTFKSLLSDFTFPMFSLLLWVRLCLYVYHLCARLWSDEFPSLLLSLSCCYLLLLFFCLCVCFGFGGFFCFCLLGFLFVCFFVWFFSFWKLPTKVNYLFTSQCFMCLELLLTTFA